MAAVGYERSLKMDMPGVYSAGLGPLSISINFYCNKCGRNMDLYVGCYVD